MQKFLQSDEELLGALASESAFGTSKIQRLAGWGYNRAARKAEEWLKDGKIRPLESTPHRFVLCSVPGPTPAPKSIAESGEAYRGTSRLELLERLRQIKIPSVINIIQLCQDVQAMLEADDHLISTDVLLAQLKALLKESGAKQQENDVYDLCVLYPVYKHWFTCIGAYLGYPCQEPITTFWFGDLLHVMGIYSSTWRLILIRMEAFELEMEQEALQGSV